MKPERFQILLRTKTLKIERITSFGNTTPEGKWLKSRKNEWVAVLSGAANLRFKGGKIMAMKPGGHVLIRAGQAHRVEWTRPGKKTIWLAVHY